MLILFIILFLISFILNLIFIFRFKIVRFISKKISGVVLTDCLLSDWVKDNNFDWKGGVFNGKE